ncbi:unnamed protein product [Urochloa humidicola]
MLDPPLRSPSGSSPSTLDLLIEGVKQTIEIPLKEILVKLMEKLPAKKRPVFKCKSYGAGSFEASVELNVTGSNVTVEPSVGATTLFGEIASSYKLSQESVVKRAFEYLETKHFMLVIDYSSKVVENYHGRFVFAELSSVSYVLEKVLAEWSLVLGSVGKFHSELERNEMRETIHGVRSVAGDIYADSRNFVGTLLTRYTEKHRAMYLEYKEYEAQRAKYLRERNDKMNIYIQKGYRQKVSFSEKDVLEYTLNYLHLPAAEYNNKPLDSGLFRGEEKMEDQQIHKDGAPDG